MYRADCDRVNTTVAAAVAAASDPLAVLEVWIDQHLAVVYDALPTAPRGRVVVGGGVERRRASHR